MRFTTLPSLAPDGRPPLRQRVPDRGGHGPRIGVLRREDEVDARQRRVGGRQWTGGVEQAPEAAPPGRLAARDAVPQDLRRGVEPHEQALVGADGGQEAREVLRAFDGRSRQEERIPTRAEGARQQLDVDEGGVLIRPRVRQRERLDLERRVADVVLREQICEPLEHRRLPGAGRAGEDQRPHARERP
ncbi:MAG: hypothetical protein AVDCRST_MAG30-2777 [uncultured Solirubrobacteraceae bacterium]|uniref:Uncharacterized protein n=1 Tax=uncultured Solirubrobacteraceae bacterium TaxID=1162706 RepID=A0A6J4T7T4_9ACTN|nr:MAG: hypothetical protein AVDCRST_MAG30-2777 [uncultured Solirubrobacteraceae bacterium]